MLFPLLVLGKQHQYADRDHFHELEQHHEEFFINTLKSYAPRAYNVRGIPVDHSACVQLVKKEKKGKACEYLAR